MADDAIVSTMGKGVGASAEEALEDSFRDAVERAVGVFVDKAEMHDPTRTLDEQSRVFAPSCTLILRRSLL